MPAKRPARPDVTPAGQLAEAKLHFVLGYQLAQAAIVTNGLFIRNAGKPFGLRPVEYTVLTLIAENPGGSQARLARALAVTAPNITAIVDRLEAKGLIARSRSEDDRRSQALQATRQGEEVARKATQGIVDAERAALSALSAGEQMILVELLHKVACARPPAGA
jgi:DNA-binding MarR family transcriptional regulator